MCVEFKDFYYAVMYVNPKEKTENTEQVKKILGCVFIKNIIYICVFQYCCDFENGDNIII